MADIADWIVTIDSRYWETGFFLLILVYTVLVLLEARTYTPGGQLFPVLIGVVLVVLTLTKMAVLLLADRLDIQQGGLFDRITDDVVSQSPTAGGGAKGRARDEFHRYRREFEMIGWVFALLALLVLLGFQLTIVSFLPAFVYRFEHSARRAVAVTVFTWVGVYLVFIQFLRVPLPAGLLIPDVIAQLLP